MKKHKICIVGNGLTGLISALILNHEEIDIDLIAENKINKIKDLRSTAISEANFDYLKKKIKNLKINHFNPIHKINLYYEGNNKIKNFLNFNEQKKLMFFFENTKLKSHLFKLIRQTKIKILNKQVKAIDPLNNKIITNTSSKIYDLVILCLGPKSKIYKKLLGNREIGRDYYEQSITGNVKHNIRDLGAQQYFLKEGPLAVLPFKKNSFSIVWSLDNKYYFKNKKNILLITKNKLSNLLKTKKIKIDKIQSYPLRLSLKTKYFKKNILILGDGLHTIHPIAGQGFNLILRDIRKVNELIKYNIRLGLSLKDSGIFKNFTESRKPENLLLGLGIDSTRKFFKSNRYFDPLKENILDTFSKSELLKNLAKRIANLGVN